jgi:hypothetical protein
LKSSALPVTSVARCRDGLRGDHAVEQLAPRIAGGRHDGRVGVRRQTVEGHDRDRGQHGVQASPPEGRVPRLAVDATLELDPGHDRHEHGIVEGRDPVGDRRVAVPEVNRDVGVDQVGHGRQRPGRSEGSSASRRSISGTAGMALSRSIIAATVVGAR